MEFNGKIHVYRSDKICYVDCTKTTVALVTFPAIGGTMPARCPRDATPYRDPVRFHVGAFFMLNQNYILGKRLAVYRICKTSEKASQ